MGGVDSRKRSSLYIVSDSRLTAVRSDSREILGKFTDEAQKLFACDKEPHVFGYSGSASYPVTALETLVDLIDFNSFFSKSDNPRRRQANVQTFLKDRLSLDRRPDQRLPFSIAHGAREGAGMRSRFHLWVLEWSPSGGWKTKKKYMRRESVLLYSDGTGKTRFRTRDRAWKKSEIGKKSRGVFGAFCEALSSGADLQSAGAPQLVGIFNGGPARYFGVVYRGRHYLKGNCVDGAIPCGIKWFNEAFEQEDPISKKVIGQRQPRPKTLTKVRRGKNIFGFNRPKRRRANRDLFPQ